MIHIGPVDPHRLLGACCIYKITNIATGKAYIGKTIWALEKYIRRELMRRKNGIIGHALRKHGRAAFRSEILLVGTEAYCFEMERKLIEAYGTQKPGGYNVGEGGEGFTSEEAKVSAAQASELRSRKAGYPTRRVLAELEKAGSAGCMLPALAASLKLTPTKAYGAICKLRADGYYIDGKGRTGKSTDPYRLFPNAADAADAWYGGDELRNEDRLLGALMEGPRTQPELMTILGYMTLGQLSYPELAKKGYVLECRGGNSTLSIPGTYHLIIDHKRHPWLHLHTMDLHGAALDDTSNRTYALVTPPPMETVPVAGRKTYGDRVLEVIREAGLGVCRAAIEEATGFTRRQVESALEVSRKKGYKITNENCIGRPALYHLVGE